MKSFLSVVAFALITHTGLAQAHYPDQIRTSQSSAYSGSTQVGVGVTTIAPIPRAAAAVGNGTALTATFDFSNCDTLQALLAFPQTSGAFTFGTGLLYKRTIAGDISTGFHVGGGLNLGVDTASTLSLGFAGLVGFHFEPINHVRIHMDAGPSLSLYTSTPVQTNFSFSALSSLLGISAVYVF